MLAYNLRYEAATGGPLAAAGTPAAAMAATPLQPAVDALCRFEVGAICMNKLVSFLGVNKEPTNTIIRSA